MGAQLRVYRRRIRSVQSTKKITRAMELIAASRIAKAQQAVDASKPYATRSPADLGAGVAAGDRPPARVGAETDPRRDPGHHQRPRPGRRLQQQRHQAGAAARRAPQAEGKQAVSFLIGRKAVSYYKFRNKPVEQSWTGFSEKPDYSHAREAADALISAFVTPTEEGGVDEIHVVHTDYVSALTQKPVANRVLPLVVEESDAPPPEGALPLYEFEPSAEELLNSLLPRYVQTRVYAALLEAAASESASRHRAMKAATDNAEELIKSLTRAANAARQAEITPEISEIVGGAAALADA